jgi:hypothetical protein
VIEMKCGMRWMGGTRLRENADFERLGMERRCGASFSCSLQKLGHDGTLRMSNMTGSIAIIIACSPMAGQLGSAWLLLCRWWTNEKARV